MKKCKDCEFMMENKKSINIRTKRGMMKPNKQYCTNGGFRELTYKALGKYGYPVWCPCCKSTKTCIECGALIREEEGDYCEKHK